MPSTYAHSRFGEQILPLLSGSARQCITRFRRMFDMGLQGPDIFYYHNPFLKTAAGALGATFHQQTGTEFFERCSKAATSEAARAYLYGLLGHYCLDCACHPFVEKKVAAGEAEHIPMEKEFERYLMALDGIAQPHAEKLGNRIHLTRGECVTVASFYPGAEPADVNSSVKFMAIALNFLAKGDRGLIGRAIARFHPGLLEHAIPSEADKSRERMNSELLARFNRAVRDYPEMLSRLEAHLKTGEELGEDFAPIFG